MIFILEKEDAEYYKHDKSKPIFGYTVPDLPTILRVCSNGDGLPPLPQKSNQLE